MEIQKTSIIRLPICHKCKKEAVGIHVLNVEGIFFHIPCLNELIMCRYVSR